MATRGRKRRQERRARRREQRDLRKRGPEKSFYGGSETALSGLREEAAADIGKAESRYEASDAETKRELGRSRALEERSDADRRGYEQTAKGSRDQYSGDVERIGWAAYGSQGQRDAALGGATGIRNQAYAQNQLTGTAENALARRMSELSGVPTIGQAVESNIGANTAAAQVRLAQGMGLASRQARGLAGSMGEGGALALQQAMASSGANAADLLAQNNTQQSQLAADLRLQAAMRQNELDVESANLGLGTRMSAAEQERANQMAIANANAGDTLSTGNANAANTYDSALQTAVARSGLAQLDAANREAAGARQLNLLGSRMDMAAGLQQAAQQGVRDANQVRSGMEGAQLGVTQADSAAAYAAAQENSPFNKLKKVVGAHDALKGTAPLSNLFGFGNK